MARVVHNVGGVRGLHVALDVFDEAVERRLFDLVGGHAFDAEKRDGVVWDLPRFPVDIFRLCNAVRDCGVFPEFLTPNYAHYINYPEGGKSQFMAHFDSRYRWAETVVGISFGRGSIIYFTPDAKHLKDAPPPDAPPDAGSGADAFRSRVVHGVQSFAIELELPRRSIYIMSGESRTLWKHGIRPQTASRLAAFSAPPPWNPLGARRSIILRCQKAFSDACLQQQLARTPDDTRLRERIAAQAKFKAAEGECGPDLVAAYLRALDVLPVSARFRSDEVTCVAAAAGGEGGWRLGGPPVAQAPDGDEEAQLQQAIALSLAAAPATGGAGASSEAPIDLDDDDDDDGTGGAVTAPLKRAREAATPAAPTAEEMREARLRRFGM